MKTLTLIRKLLAILDMILAFLKEPNVVASYFVLRVQQLACKKFQQIGKKKKTATDGLQVADLNLAWGDAFFFTLPL